jgi:hypothetical protein
MPKLFRGVRKIWRTREDSEFVEEPVDSMGMGGDEDLRSCGEFSVAGGRRGRGCGGSSLKRLGSRRFLGGLRSTRD